MQSHLIVFTGVGCGYKLKAAEISRTNRARHKRHRDKAQRRNGQVGQEVSEIPFFYS